MSKNYKIIISNEDSRLKKAFTPQIECFNQEIHLNQQNMKTSYCSISKTPSKKIVSSSCLLCQIHSFIKIKPKSSNSLIIQFNPSCDITLHPDHMKTRPTLSKRKYSTFFDLPLQYLRECRFLKKEVYFQQKIRKITAEIHL